ncbi:MAG: DUF4870 domain-containing protein [Clostridia bacterium]|jgi:uncharacterized membrane protein|nr:DUF4870 domain-containing protein [Clostridia bacterium]
MDEKAKGILAYIFGWIGGLIVLYAVKDNQRNTKFHAAQAIVLSAGYFVINIAYNFIPFTIPFFGTILHVVYLMGIIFGIVKVCKQEDPELPVLGGIAKSIFGKKIDE